MNVDKPLVVRVAVVLLAPREAGRILVNEVMEIPSHALQFGEQLQGSATALIQLETGLVVDPASLRQIWTCNEVAEDSSSHTVTILLSGTVTGETKAASDRWHWMEWDVLRMLPSDDVPPWVRHVRAMIPEFTLPAFDAAAHQQQQPDEAHRESVAILVDLGFVEAEARHACKECRGDVDRAVAYLLACQNQQPTMAMEDEAPRIPEAKRNRDADQQAAAAAHDEWTQNKRANLSMDTNDDAQNEQMRCYLWQEQFNGGRLTREQYNFLLAPDAHTAESMYECSVCYVEYELADLAILESCRHHLCATCMAMYFKTEIAAGRGNTLVCPNPECKQPVTLGDVERLAEPEAADQYRSLLLEDHLQKDPNCRRCPKPDCGLAMIGSKESPMMRCPKETCGYTFCFSCRVQWHADTTCEKYQAWCLENGDAESRFEAWRKKNTKPCPKCARPIEKWTGCNHVVCPNKGGCGAEFCWLCLCNYGPGHYNKGTCKGKQFT